MQAYEVSSASSLLRADYSAALQASKIPLLLLPVPEDCPEGAAQPQAQPAEAAPADHLCQLSSPGAMQKAAGCGAESKSARTPQEAQDSAATPNPVLVQAQQPQQGSTSQGGRDTQYAGASETEGPSQHADQLQGSEKVSRAQGCAEATSTVGKQPQAEIVMPQAQLPQAPEDERNPQHAPVHGSHSTQALAVGQPSSELGLPAAAQREKQQPSLPECTAVPPAAASLAQETPQAVSQGTSRVHPGSGQPAKRQLTPQPESQHQEPQQQGSAEQGVDQGGPQGRTVRCALLVPCCEAVHGRFPLNGTYFQTNEVFMDASTLERTILVSPLCNVHAWYCENGQRAFL